jgi:oxygen-dependent protoporphyrinogen oxidase
MVELRTGRAEAIERAPSGFRVRLAGDWIEAGHVVMACEAHSAAHLLGGIDAPLSQLLQSVPYGSSMMVALGYDAAEFREPPRGFGFLVPARERRQLVACTWVGNKFPHRAPPGTVVARCSLSCRSSVDILAQSDDAAIAIAIEELRAIAGMNAKPRFARVFRWPRSMAQYPVGHERRIAEVEARLREIPGLHLAGNAYQGIGIPDCIRTGHAAAEKVLAAGSRI